MIRNYFRVAQIVIEKIIIIIIKKIIIGNSQPPYNILARSWDVSQPCFLNSIHKHIKLVLAGYSRLYSDSKKFSEQYRWLKRN